MKETGWVDGDRRRALPVVAARASADRPADAHPHQQAITALAEEGPGLGRPLVDTIAGSTYPNLKELRLGSAGGTEVRLLFIFDPRRRAVFLVGGDKAGNGQPGTRRLSRRPSMPTRSTCDTRRRSEQPAAEQPERTLLG